MTFLWPSALIALLVLPVIVAIYLRLQRRQRTLADSFGAGTLPGLRSTSSSPGFRRHLPALFFLLGLAIMLAALARPQAEISLPRIEGTVVLVFDVSASMAATDAAPTRLEAAKAVAREFVLNQPSTVQTGIVSFSGSGFTVQAPTNDANQLLAAIDRLEPTSGTSLGQGILAALHTIAVDAGLVADAPAQGNSPAEEGATPAATPDAGSPGDPGGASAEQRLLAQLPEAAYPASVIVLLTDGEDNQSFDPLAAAQAAAQREVRVDALGFGTAAGATLELDGFNVHTALDEANLQQITEAGGGSYRPARAGEDLREVVRRLAPELVVKPETMEITSIFAGASILFLLMGGLFSVTWFTRLP